jgi:membrane fusion protein
MSSSSDLFRKEVLDSDGKRGQGAVLLVYPLSTYFMVMLALALLAALCVFAVMGQYTRHATVAGVLEPSEGVVKMYASQTGILKTSFIKEGQSVKKGDVLLVFESAHQGVSGQAVEDELDVKLSERLATLHRERDGTLQLQDADVLNMRRNLLALKSNSAASAVEILTQSQRVKSAQEMVTRFQQLEKAGYMPAFQTQQKIDALMEQQMRLQALQKAATSADDDIARLALQLNSSQLRKQVTQAQLDRTISSTESELSKQQSGHEWSVIAPCDGMVTSLTIAANQNTSMNLPLVSIVPAASILQANLYAPSRALGFLRPGQVVAMKLDAFPYQKFGMIYGKVIAIADSPGQATESTYENRLATSARAQEPVYTIRVAIDQQFIYAYGEKQRLRPGIQLDAEIRLETRALYEWVLEPLYSLRRSHS